MTKKIWMGFILIINLPLFSQSYMMLWHDEFSTDGLPDAATWSYEEGLIRNDEAQYYTSRSENARVENGCLIIEARKEEYEGSHYTSASLNTRNSNLLLYGRVEVRAKIPTGRGMWPAIWMLGVNIDQVSWPACGEIDIMENVGYDPDKIHGTVHTEAYNHMIGTQRGKTITVTKPYDDFHIYAIEWRADRIDWYYDDQKYFTFKNEGTGVQTWPFAANFYLLINAAVGGSWGGQEGIDDTIFPQQYLIDYVRVFEMYDDPSGVENQGAAPSSFHLLPNYPNPFNGRTVIPFELARNSSVRFRIYAVNGNLLQDVLLEKEAGYHEFVWDGTNKQGVAMPSGAYIVHMRDGLKTMSERITLVN